jgi:outer membrane protein assembly factor BamB
MKTPISSSSLIVALLWTAILPTNAQVNVTQEHNNLSRDGLYIDPAFTPANAANLRRDLNFNGTISGNVYAQPLYIEGGPNGAMVIAVTESNNVYALNATTGAVIWQRNLGPAVTSGLPCGNISPLGITGTPVVDLASRSLFVDAMIDGATKKHFVYSLNVDTGATRPNWPVDLNATANHNGTPFTSLVQNERGGLAIVNNILYIAFSGHAGDCGTYHGWVIGIPINNPSNVMAWATDAIGGGIWGHGGVASDGTNMFVVTGNTFATGGTWMGGEAIIRLQAGPIFTRQPADYWAPTNWFSLDSTDTDLGGVSATLVDVPGATPSQLVLALGKDGKGYLINRNNLGGVIAPVASVNLPSAVRGQSVATYHTSQGTYFAFHTENGAVAAYKVTATSPPTIVPAWSVSQTGLGSAWVTSTNGTNNAIVWVAGSGGDGRLHAYNGDTGNVIYAGGGANEVMSGTRKWNTGIVARGRIYYPADNKIYAFTVPIGTPASPLTSRAAVADFNGDGHPDFVVQNAATHQTVIGYLNDNVVVGAAYGPTLPGGWKLKAAADFNRDSYPDYALLIPSTQQTIIGYLSGPTVIGAALGPALPGSWELVATADFDGDGYPDYVVYHESSRLTAIVHMNNNVVIDAVLGPTLPVGSNVVGVADFTGDGHRDYALFNPNTGYTAIWYLNDNVFVSSAAGPTLPIGWALVATADFNGDGKPDYVVYHASSRLTAIVHMNNYVAIDVVFGPTLPADWSLTAP